MKNKYFILCSLASFLLLGACSINPAKEELSLHDKQKPTASVEQISSSRNVSISKKSSDMWTHYQPSSSRHSWEGLVFSVDQISVTDKYPITTDDDTKGTTSAVAVKFKLTNTTTDKVYSTYPDQAILVTSTGEEISVPEPESDIIGGAIDEGVTKEGQVLWKLNRGHASDIEWIKLKWSSSYEDPNGNFDNDKYQEHEIKINLAEKSNKQVLR